MLSARPNRFLVWLVALSTAGSGLINIYSVIGEGLAQRTRLLEKIFPLEFQNFSRSLTLVIGFALIVSSINIYKRKRRAFQLVVAVSVLSIMSHLAKGLDYEDALVSLLLLLVLLLTRKYFNVRSSVPSFILAVIRAAAGFLVVFCYGVAGFWLLEEREFGFNFHLADAIKRTVLIISFIGDTKLTPQTVYAHWFANSVYLMTFMAITYAGLAFFRPILYRYRTLPLERLQAAGILSQYGRSALDFFKLWRDKSYYFNDEGNCFIAYRVGKNYAIALSDPVGSVGEVEETVREYQPPIPNAILLQTKSVSDGWLNLPGRRERQFSLGMFDEAYVGTTPLYVVADASGKMFAFVNAIKSYRQGEATIDLMRHCADAPNGTMDYLFTKLFLDCKAKGFQQFSLGMAPFDGFRKSEHPSAEERAIDYLMRHLNFIFSYSGLHHFKAKFADAWEPRYLVYHNVLALPQVALALAKISELR